MRNITAAVSLAIPLLLTAVSVNAQDPRDFDALVRLRMEQARREKAYEELQEKTAELAETTQKLVEEVEATNAYTTSAAIVEASDRIEDLANEIEDLASDIEGRRGWFCFQSGVTGPPGTR